MGSAVASSIVEYASGIWKSTPTRPLTFLITGGTGTIGTALTRELLTQGHKVRAFARNEHSHERLISLIDSSARDRLSNLIGDVRDRSRMMLACQGADIVIHAAAMKIIPRCEYDPQEAIRTNVNGTENVADAVLACDVSKAIFVSSDKARAPCTHYGATKLVAERAWLASNVYWGGRPHRFAAVVYGNVFGSRGSALHAFRAQAKLGKIQITDKRCTRFHITIDQAVALILRACRDAEPGEIWVPKLPAYKVTDLAEAIAPAMEQEIIGLRPSEKVHELLVTEDESAYAREEKGHYIVTPNHAVGKGGWDYHSGRTTWRLGVEALREEIKTFDKAENTAWLRSS